MKRVLPFLVLAAALLALVWIGAAYAGRTIATAWERAGARPWPMQLGPLSGFEDRFPPHGTSEAALRLHELARPLGIDFTPKRKSKESMIHDAVAEYVRTHHQRGTMDVDPPPAHVAAFFDAHAREIDAVRDHLLRHGGAIAWDVELWKGFEAPVPNLLAHLQLSRMLIARGLVRRDWEDLHAASELGRSLHARPDMLSQIIALAMARAVNAAAWKMPLPPPSWLAEAHATDRRRLVMRALQAEAWVMWQHGLPVHLSPSRTYNRAMYAGVADHRRETADQLARVTACAFDPDAFAEKRKREQSWWNIAADVDVDFSAVWSRVLRAEAEEEAVANALRIRGGEPIVHRSACSDGAWRFGSGTLSFTRELPLRGGETLVLPLRLAVVRESGTAPRP